ncbi:MAG: signal peptidase I, partial [Oscillospiraceae bacterium]|nr:signal peptidase I [Oscillospiraceae bacterium]
AVKDGDLAIVFRLQKNYVKNDVVIYTHTDRRCVGRIAAGPGDVVIIDETGTLLVNNTTQTGQILYPTYPTEELTYPYTVPEGCYFVLGDFRTRADDSRHFGAVPRDELNGKVITVIRRRGL